MRESEEWGHIIKDGKKYIPTNVSIFGDFVGDYMPIRYKVFKKAGGEKYSKRIRLYDEFGRVPSRRCSTHNGKTLCEVINCIKAPGSNGENIGKYLANRSEVEPHRPSNFFGTHADEVVKKGSKIKDLQ